VCVCGCVCVFVCAIGAQMEGVELAESIHVLFSKFDQIVMGRGLTKLDTIGKRDLYRVKSDLEIDLY
jgi:hypothetical protein